MTSALQQDHRPEPVLDAAKLAAAVSGAVTGIGGLLVLAGYATTDEVKEWAVAAGAAVVGVGALLGVVLPVITALRARDRVTPVADPRDVEGRPLVVEGQVDSAGRALDDDAGGPVSIRGLHEEYFPGEDQA